jgi:hypothetical protein
MGIAAGDTIKVTALCRTFGQRSILDLTYLCTVGNVGGDINAQQNELLSEMFGLVANPNSVLTSYRACLPPQTTIEEYRTQVVSPVRLAYFSIPAADVGSNANAATVACDAASVYRRCAAAGRRNISTLKVGPVPDASSAAGLLTNAYKIVLAEFAVKSLNTILLPASTLQFRPVILNRLTNTFDGQRFLLTFGIGAQSRTQRRRVVGRGE